MTQSPPRDEAYAFLDDYAREAAERVGVPTECSIIMRHHHLLAYVASSGPRAALCDAVEVDSGEGPCVVAIQQLRGELVPDVLATDLWPAWRRTAVDQGFRSAAALPGIVDADTTIALNLYSAEVDPWDRDALVGMDRLVQEMAELVRTRGL